jgi:glutaminyl-tRNA synthetase
MFEGMRKGLYAEGEVSLRLKIDYTNDNPTLRDPSIYRIRYTPHPHVGNKWCIYPLYDFTHCLSDSIENITHSLCTLEFEIRRDLYYWILE